MFNKKTYWSENIFLITKCLSVWFFVSYGFGIILVEYLNTIRIEIMTNGMVKWFNTNKGYGFIQPDNGNKDVFVHISAVEKSGLKTLLENQKVSFEINQDKGRSSAANIKVIG